MTSLKKRLPSVETVTSTHAAKNNDHPAGLLRFVSLEFTCVLWVVHQLIIKLAKNTCNSARRKAPVDAETK